MKKKSLLPVRVFNHIMTTKLASKDQIGIIGTTRCLLRLHCSQDQEEHFAFFVKKLESAKCSSADKLTLEEKTATVKKKNGCLACLGRNHWAKECKTFLRCPRVVRCVLKSMKF